MVAMYEDMTANHDSNNWESNNRVSLDDEGLNLYMGNEGFDDSGIRGGYSSPKYTRRSMDDSMAGGDARANRVSNTEAAIRAEMYKDCTFRPNIKGLPQHYGAMKDIDTPFNDRVAKWQRERDLSREKKSKLIEHGEQAECTFKPKINHNSNKAIKEIRGADHVEDVSKRLYQNSEVSLLQRHQLVKETKEKEEEALQQECTFQPKLITATAQVHQMVHSRLSQPLQKDIVSGTPSDLKGCTFTPKTNRIKPSMSSAKLYVSTDVIERLTRPVTAGPPPSAAAADGEPHFDNTNSSSVPHHGDSYRPVMDMASFMGSLSHNKNHNPQTPVEDAPSKKSNAESKAKRDKKFEMFLQRQQANLKKKEENIQRMQRSSTPNFKPRVGKKEGDENGTAGASTQRGDFLTRMQAEVEKRSALETENRKKLDKNCTFRPEIKTKYASARRARSTYEMSEGDALRKGANLKQLELDSKQEEEANMTFKPNISAHSKKTGKSVLQVSSNPDSSQFMEWLKSTEEKKEQKRTELLKKREEEEEAACTFKPQTTECPAYVKRIAKSMAIVKAARSSTGSLLDPEASKPQWR